MSKPNFQINRTPTPEPSKEPSKKIGALWQRQSNKGATFFSGQITITDQMKHKIENAPLDKYGNKTIDVVVLTNNYKESDSHPDYKILLGEPRPK